MKTTKRNARTTTIFNGIMTGIIKRYGIKEDMSLKEMYDAAALTIIDDFNFLDKNGKTIYNSIGENKEITNTIRGLSFPKLDAYSFGGDETIKENIIKGLSVFSFDDYNPELVKDYDINDIKREYSKYGIDYGVSRSDTNSTFLQELLDQYRLDKFHKESYLFLIEFETIFGHQCITRKEFDRIRYIIFRDLSIYDVMNGYMIPGSITCLLRQKYSVIAIAISSETGYDYEKILSNIVFKKIKNILLSFGRGVSQEKIYGICETIMLALNPSLKYLIPDYHYPIFKERVRISDILKNEFQLRHTILIDDKKIYPAYQERQESNI
jgi:hypothetical protein